MQENITEKQQEALFRRLCTKEENSICADCKSKGATWVSLGYGVFVCINCSGVHRSFGMHITRVRSTKLDSWTLADSKIMELIGNGIANSYWEFSLNNGRSRQLLRDEERMNFIRQKYITKMWAKTSTPDPVSELVKNNYSMRSEDLKAMYGATSSNDANPAKIVSFNGPNSITNRKDSKGQGQSNGHGVSKSIPTTHAHHQDEDLLCFDDISKPVNSPPLNMHPKSHSTGAFTTNGNSQNDPFAFNFTSGTNLQQTNKSKQEHPKKDPFDFLVKDLGYSNGDQMAPTPGNIGNHFGNHQQQKPSDDLFDFTRNTGQQSHPKQTANGSQNPTSFTAFPDDRYAVLDMFKLNYGNNNGFYKF
jgi:hypothetical protein